ncbi:MAG: hypothetical protein EOO04_24155 [Chitinophagaceae bacterium]|nr:MAG: hypothetical protein EOO04_24155 [Chitinophagaceae bacterium]
MIAQLDPYNDRNHPTMITSNLKFIQDSMLKNHTAMLGLYIKSDSVAHEWLPDTSKLHTSPRKWYAIKPNYKICDTNFTMKLPANYRFIDECYYIDPFEVRPFEPDVLKIVK